MGPLIHNDTPAIHPYFVLISGILAISTGAIFARLADAPPLVIAAYRVGLASLFLVPIAFWKNRAELRNLSSRDLKTTLLAGTFLALHFATWISSLQYTTISNSVVLVSMSPLWVGIFVPLLLKEKIKGLTLVSILLSVLGCAIIGFGDIHTRAHLYRAIIEGLAFAMREGKERIEKRSRTPINSLRVSGGGSQSHNALQLTADVFGLPTGKPHVYETSGLGAAIDAAVGLGFHDSFASAVKAMTRVGEVFEPHPKTHQMYDALYHEVYKKMYKHLKPLYERIRKITGYPA